jgi:hypothetical protein
MPLCQNRCLLPSMVLHTTVSQYLIGLAEMKLLIHAASIRILVA